MDSGDMAVSLDRDDIDWSTVPAQQRNRTDHRRLILINPVEAFNLCMTANIV